MILNAHVHNRIHFNASLSHYGTYVTMESHIIKDSVIVIVMGMDVTILLSS